MALFRNRREAGVRLAARLEPLRGESPVVLALPRGGVPVAAEVARVLHAPLDVMIVRKLGVPFQPELAMGAIGEGGARVLNDDVISVTNITPREIAEVEGRERLEIDRRARRYRGDAPMVALEGRTAVIIDDGIATGSTARAALQIARAHGARRVVLAVPVAPVETVEEMAGEADEVVVLETPSPFFAIGPWYDDFSQTTDEEVCRLLEASRASSDPATFAHDHDVVVSAGPLHLPGHLVVPTAPRGIVIFAHGSGSSRHSPRNVQVARYLRTAGLGTLLFDLLMPEEAVDRANVFDIELLAVRLLAATRWLRSQPATAALPIGYFGASTGAAAALWAAAEDPLVDAIVSRGGRPDLAGARLGAVVAPTLLIVGGDDRAVLRLNEEAAAQLHCEHRLDVVPGATHLFEEPGTLERVADLARDWFLRHLPNRRSELRQSTTS
jgi:putative phosphoribosyl transferase